MAADFGTMESEIKKFLDDNSSNHDLGDFGEELAQKIQDEYEKAVMTSMDSFGNGPLSIPGVTGIAPALVTFFQAKKVHPPVPTAGLIAPVMVAVAGANMSILLPATNAAGAIPPTPDSDPVGMTIVLTYVMAFGGVGSVGDYTDAFPGGQTEKTTAQSAKDITTAFKNHFLENTTIMGGTLPTPASTPSVWIGALS